MRRFYTSDCIAIVDMLKKMYSVSRKKMTEVQLILGPKAREMS